MRRLLTFVLLAGSAIVHAQCMPGAGIGVVCTGPTGLQSACPGESVTCTVEATNVGCSPLMVTEARITFHAPAGDVVAEFGGDSSSGVFLPTEGDSKDFQFTFPCPQADLGVRLEAQGTTFIQNVDAFATPPARSDFPMFLDIPVDCTVPRLVSLRVLQDQCKHCHSRRNGRLVCKGCRL